MQKILQFLRRHIIYVSIVILISIASLVFVTRDTTPTWITDTVSQGTVRNIISVSGTVNAVNSAELSFPVGGIIESIAVKEGDMVMKGQVLATLSHDDLNANYQNELASVLIAESERNVSQTTVAIAQEDLKRITNEQNDRVNNAYRTLLSTDLEAFPDNKDNSDIPPTISGTYNCKEGGYTLKMFASGARSGYSYQLSGIEGGTYTAYTESPSPLGTCGLSIQFIQGESYGNAVWTIPVPNTRSSSYVTNLNAYTLAVTQRTNAIHEAEQKLTLAQQNSTLDAAVPRVEAEILQARARLNAIGAQIKDHILTAPFAGSITHIDPVAGESIGTNPVVTMVSDDAYALTALIPEIDVTKITVGQKADIVFDARENETLKATLIFISPLATEVDGVSYFEAKFVLDTDIEWLRSGLNADVDIIIDTHENVVRIPKRYLTEQDGTYAVLVPEGENAIPKTVIVTFEGNDGYVEITGLDVGTTIIAP